MGGESGSTKTEEKIMSKISKLNLKRVFLRDDKGNLYRIFAIANNKDHKGESYIKIIIPDIKDVPLITGKHNKGGIVTDLDRLNGGISEFSYHYRSGVSHLKDSKIHIDQKRGIATLHEHQALHLVRFIIRSLDTFKIQKESKITENDFVLPIAFDGKPRGFELAISRTSGGWNIINEQGTDPVHTYKIGLTDPNVSFHIADSLWHRPPIQPGDCPFEIFRYDDPTSNFEFKPL